MSQVIRVLVVDDSPIARQAIKAILHSVPDVQVVGEATNGREGVELAEQLRPDVITMDVNMPVMNGHMATLQIMARTPTPIVVVTSVTHDDMLHQGFDILLDGALDVVQKPSGLAAQSFDAICAQLINSVKTVAQVKFPGPAADPSV